MARPIDYSKWKDIEVSSSIEGEINVEGRRGGYGQFAAEALFCTLSSLPFQVSDDEDDTHPNIDTPSLFKWRHEARVQRDQEFDHRKKETEAELKK
jgi:hypothetical protein